MNLNCAQNSASLPNLKTSQEFHQNNNQGEYQDNSATTLESSNNSTDDETASRRGSIAHQPLTPHAERDDHSALAEFETKHFPVERSSSRGSSMIYDDISITSSLDMAAATHSTIQELNDEIVEVDDSATTNHVIKTTPVKCQPKSASARLVVAIYKQPMLMLLLILLSTLPMAILLQMANARS